MKSPATTGNSMPAAFYTYVRDVDAHHAKAKAAGADVDEQPFDADWGDRCFEAVDPSGYRWMFATEISR